MFKKVLGAIGVLAGTLFFVHSAKAVEMPRVVINELMWMGSSSSSSDEWIELRNTTDAPIDLIGWSLTKLSSGAETPMLTIPSGTIPANGFFVIANFSAENSRLAVTPNLVDTDVSLVNSRLQIKLYDAASTLVDTADDGVGNPLSGEYVSGTTWKSMERNPNGVDGTVAESWHVSVLHDGFDDALKEFGTPGSRNSNRPPVIAVSITEEARVDEDVLFDASETTDDSSEISFAWEFGDGTTANGLTPTHRYGAAGTYTVRLTVSDGEEVVVSENTITIRPAPSTPSTTLVVSQQEEGTGSEDASMETPSTQVEPTPSVPPTETRRTSNARVVLNELFPDPDGMDRDSEFLEIKNIGNTSINLRGWAVAIGKKKSSISRDINLGPGKMESFLTVELGVQLPNAKGGTVFLLDASGTVVNGVRYGRAQTDKSFSRTGKGDWQWTDPTPDAVNVFPVVRGARTESRTVITTIEGTVVKKVGRSMVLNTTAGEQRAVAALGSDVSFRDLRVGDHVRLTGELRQTDNGPRLYPRTLDDIEVLDSNEVFSETPESFVPAARAAQAAPATTTVASNDRSILETTVYPILLSAAIGFGVWGWRRKRDASV